VYLYIFVYRKRNPFPLDQHSKSNYDGNLKGTDVHRYIHIHGPCGYKDCVCFFVNNVQYQTISSDIALTDIDFVSIVVD